MIPNPFDLRPHAKDYFTELALLLKQYQLHRLVGEELEGLADAVDGDGTFLRYIADRRWGIRHQAMYDLSLTDPNGDRLLGDNDDEGAPDGVDY